MVFEPGVDEATSVKHLLTVPREQGAGAEPPRVLPSQSLSSEGRKADTKHGMTGRKADTKQGMTGAVSVTTWGSGSSVP